MNSDVRNSSPAIAGSPFGSPNRWICGSSRIQFSPYGESSHILRTIPAHTGKSYPDTHGVQP